VLGSAVGLLLALAIALSATSPRAPIHCNGWIAAGSIVLITVVCLLAAWLPYWRVRRIDPAAVLRGP
jgi:ABC-type antimicrobial peptide transport system permease subunit